MVKIVLPMLFMIQTWITAFGTRMN